MARLQDLHQRGRFNTQESLETNKENISNGIKSHLGKNSININFGIRTKLNTQLENYNDENNTNYDTSVAI